MPRWKFLGTLAPICACLAALTWIGSWWLVGQADILFPTDFGYFVVGVGSGLLGLLLLPVLLVMPFGNVLRVIGVAISVLLILSGVIAALGSAGVLAQQVPLWIAQIDALPLFALFIWIPLTSLLRRGALGRSVVVAGILVALSLASGVAINAINYVHTNDTMFIDTIAALLFLGSFPAWCFAVAVRLWKTRHRWAPSSATVGP